MSKLTKYFSMTMVAVLFLGMFYILTPHAYAATNMAIVNPLDDTNSFSFTTDDLPVGGTFAINLTVISATELATWQARVEWNPTFLEFVSFVFPSDDVFFNKSPIRAPTDSSVPGSMLAGAVAGPGAGSFTGTGTLGVLTLKILDGADSTCPIQYTNLGSDTFLLDINGNDIAFTLINGVYTLTKVAAGKPSFSLVLVPTKPTALGDNFAVEVWVDKVDPNAEIVAFQFSIMWNTALIGPDPRAGVYYDNGTFLEGKQYQSDGVIYAVDINAHNRPPPDNPIADGYNYSTVGLILMPDALANNTYHAPFPTGKGMLATLYFNATFETVAPNQITSMIQFIAEDFLVLSASSIDVGYKTATGVLYFAPMTSIGLAIDVFTQYGGIGADKTSDSFGPQQEVNLCATLTYNAFGVPGKLVAFEINHKSNNSEVTFHFAREATTNANGTACIAFKIPWSPTSTGDVFGWWYVNATGDMIDLQGQKPVDNLRFYVWWPVEVTSIEPKFTTVTQRSGGSGESMNFALSYRTYQMREQNVTLTGTIYDELKFFIGSNALVNTTVSAPVYTDVKMAEWTDLPPPANTYDWNFSVPLSPNAVVGKGTAYGNAFNNWPWIGGVALCPEVTNTGIKEFFISKPTT